MNTKRERTPIKKSRLENEVILSVVILYVLLSAAMLAIHHIQPDEAETKTSSTSAAHAKPEPAPTAPPAGQNAVGKRRN